jgi:hypothetical protein
LILSDSSDSVTAMKRGRVQSLQPPCLTNLYGFFL